MAWTPAGGIIVALAIGAAAALGGGAWLLTRPAPTPPVAEADSPPAEAERPPAPVPAPPSLDVVRIAPDGAGIVAGRAAPGARVTLQAGEMTLAETEASPGGEFVTSFRVEPATEPQRLILRSEDAAGAAVSDEDVLLLPPSPPAAVTTAEDGTVSPGPEAAPSPSPSAIAATAILRPDGPEVLPGPAATDTLSLASIDYAASGEVTLSGFAPPGAPVRVYVDDAHALDALADRQGRWEADLADIGGGDHRLRVDALDADGTVTRRVETPFRREYPDPAGVAGSVTVQPGANLWTIARHRYGAGIHYTRIYTANSHLIRDPDLIYPGQIFVLPEDVAETAEEATSRP